MIYSQRNPSWAAFQLGSLPGATFGQYGCLLCVFAQVATDLGIPTDPPHMNGLLLAAHQYVNGDQLTDRALAAVFPELHYQGSFPQVNGVLDLAALNAPTPLGRTLAQIDFNHNPADGLQEHWVTVASWNGRDLMIEDPWTGTLENFNVKYGQDPAHTVKKTLHYQRIVMTQPPPLPVDELTRLRAFYRQVAAELANAGPIG